MSSIDPRTPVIIGVAQKTVHRGEQPGPEPLVAWEEVGRSAARDAGVPESVLESIGALAITDCMSWAYDDGLARLSERLGARPKFRTLGKPSGTSGQTLLAKLTEEIRSGRTDLALLSGGESLATVKHYYKQGQTPPWSHRHPDPHANEFDLKAHQHPDEAAAGLLEDVGAVYNFAMRDVARRAHLKIEPETYRRQLGELLSGMTRVAAHNPDAWFPAERSADFLITPRPDNRPVSYPYTKHMVAIIEVDIHGAVLLASEAKANELGVPKEKRVYPWAISYAEDPVYIAVRENLWKSDALEAAANAVLDAAGVTMKDVSYVDLYSCFTSAVKFGCDALGISDWPGDKITVTGGLAYGGGPASAYMLTSIPKMVENLRKDPGSLGLVSGLGMMMSNHTLGVYSNTPPGPRVRAVDNAAVQAKVDAIPQRKIDGRYVGPATITTYTVMYDRAGDISHGAAICDLPTGDRAYVRIFDKDLLQEAERTELVGRPVTIKPGQGVGEAVRA